MNLVKRVALRVMQRQASQSNMGEAIQASLQKYLMWSADFPSTLAAAEAQSTTIPDGWILQDEMVEFWRPFDAIQRELFELSDTLEEESPKLWSQMWPYLDPPPNAQIEYATASTRFFEDPETTYSQIGYSVSRIQQWHLNFYKWLSQAVEGVKRVQS